MKSSLGGMEGFVGEIVILPEASAIGLSEGAAVTTVVVLAVVVTVTPSLKLGSGEDFR